MSLFSLSPSAACLLTANHNDYFSRPRGKGFIKSEGSTLTRDIPITDIITSTRYVIEFRSASGRSLFRVPSNKLDSRSNLNNICTFL